MNLQKLLGHSRATTTDNYLQSLNPVLYHSIRKLDENPTKSPTIES